MERKKAVSMQRYCPFYCHCSSFAFISISLEWCFEISDPFHKHALSLSVIHQFWHWVWKWLSWYSCWATDRTTEVSGFDFWQGQKLILPHCIQTGYSTPPPIRWVPEVLFLGVKQPKHETDCSPLSSAEVKNIWSCTSIPLYASILQWSVLCILE
jgi:hypothetical protein